MYPKVKVGQHQHQEEDEYDDGDVRDLGLKSFLSLSFHSSTSPVKDQRVLSMPSIVKVPNCYVPQVQIPRVTVTEDFEDCNLPIDSYGPEKDVDTDENDVNIIANVIPRVTVTEDFRDCSLTSNSSEPEKDGKIDENKVNIRASSIPPPRAVISSPDNDKLIRNRNRIRDERLSASKNGTVFQNRHAHSKVKSNSTTDIPPETRKCKESGSKDKSDPVGEKRVHKSNIKSDWKF